MKHHAFAAMGLFAAALIGQGAPSHAAPADPTGFWVKPGSERNAKIHVRKCGKGLCANIVWVEDPNDSKGKPLRDIRNENPSLRGRPIVGLPLFAGLAPSAPGVWTGKIYNPEDGNTYSVTLTVVSRQQIKLKGCKGWVLCGERVWNRTSPPPKEPKPEETIEASNKPDAGEKPKAEPAVATKAEPPAAEPQAAEPAPTVQAAATPAEAPQPMGLAEETEMNAGAAPKLAAEPLSPEEHARSGYRFLNASVTPETTARYSGENVPSMFVMTKPVAGDAATTRAAAPVAAPATQAAVEPEESAPPPAPAPKPAMQASTTPSPKPKPRVETPRVETPSVQAAAAPKQAAKPAPQGNSARQQAAPAPQETPQDSGVAEAESAPPQKQAATSDETAAPPPMTRRQKRLLRRQQMQQQMGQQPFLPWLRGTN